jgi:cobalt/nickel transport system permease protein
MKSLEVYAYRTPLKNWHPIEKIVFAIFPLILSIILQNTFTSLFVLLMMTFNILVIGKIPFKFYLKLLLVPVAFLLSSIAMILLTFTTTPVIGEGLLQYQFGPIYVTILEASTKRAMTLFSVALSGVSCLYFLILTTTIQDILIGLDRCKVPTILLDLIGLTYRFIFIFIDSGRTIYIAQMSRLGNVTFLKHLKSFGLLISALLVKVLYEVRELNNAVNSRSMNGYIIFINQHFNFHKTRWLLISFVVISIITFHFTIGRVV